MSALLALIPRWVWAALVAALAATSCKLTIDLGSVKLELEKAKVAMAEQERAYETARADAAETLASAQERARKAEQAITVATATVREETHAQVLAANAAADALRQRLRDAQAKARAETVAAYVPRSAEPATAQAPPPEPVGAILPDGTGSDLVSLAQRAEQARLELVSCRREYESARTEVEALKSQAKPQ